MQVHLDTDGGWLTGRPRLPQLDRRSGLTCDGTLTPVWETDGHPVNVGRAQRVVPHRTRVLVLDRDRGCRFPGCGSTRNLEIHHLIHWRDGGPTDTTNLLALCAFHHDGHHRGEFTITGDPTRPDGLTFHDRHRPAHRPTPATTSASAPRPTEPDRKDPPERRRPPARLGRRYPAPTGGPCTCTSSTSRRPDDDVVTSVGLAALDWAVLVVHGPTNGSSSFTARPRCPLGPQAEADSSRRHGLAEETEDTRAGLTGNERPVSREA